MDEATAPPGWYRDSRDGGLRYWDGRAWTEHRRPLTTRKFTLGKALALVAALPLSALALGGISYGVRKESVLDVLIAGSLAVVAGICWKRAFRSRPAQ